MGIGLGIDYVTWWEILKWIPPTSKLHVGHQNKNSKSYGYRVRKRHVTWWEIPKWIPPTSKLHVGHQKKIPILWV